MAGKKMDDERSSRHDDLVAELLVNSSAVFEALGLPSRPPPLRLTTELPCSAGFVDLFAQWDRSCHPDGAPRIVIVEVKSNLETWAAGDVIRQLKRYSAATELDKKTGIKWPIGEGALLAFFPDRKLSTSEQVLIEHEKIAILKPTWRQA